ncbi:hypothetical protein D3C85_1679330 [compost metagenome]
MLPPTFSATRGVPPVVSTRVASSMVTVMLTTSPAFRRLFCAPLAPLMAMLSTPGATSSTRSLIPRVTACSLALPAASVATTVKL